MDNNFNNEVIETAVEAVAETVTEVSKKTSGRYPWIGMGVVGAIGTGIGVGGVYAVKGIKSLIKKCKAKKAAKEAQKQFDNATVETVAGTTPVKTETVNESQTEAPAAEQ